MSEDVYFASASELAARIRAKSLSPVEIVQAHLDRIDALNPKLNAIVLPAENAMDRAREAEAAVMRGDPLGSLHGVPYTLKDCVEVAGMRATLGSKLYETNVSEIDAPVYTRLRDAGGILLGKTNMPEFALWWQTDNLVFGRTDNPWALDRTPGGSSGGEAAAIAAGLSPLGVGTDLGGSIREPAAFCGIFGLKPTLGRVPYTGVEPQTLLRAMHAGPMARTVQDIALGLSIMAGADGRDIYAPPVAVPDYVSGDANVAQLKIGWSPTGGAPVVADVQHAVAQAAEALKSAGADVEPVEIPVLADRDSGDISSVIYMAEAGRHLAPIIKGRESDLTSRLAARYVDLPATTLEQYLGAAEQWEAMRLEVAEFFTRFDLFLCPTVPMPAYPHDQRNFSIEGHELQSRHALRATVPWDLTGSPAMAVPFGWNSDDLPISVQLVGRHFDEPALLRAGRVLEAALPSDRRPPV